MPLSKTDIANLALDYIGHSQRIGTFDETSVTAATIRLHYDTCLRKILRDFPWAFAKKIVALSLVAADPSTEWAFSYRVPADCLKVRRIIDGGDRFQREVSSISFDKAADNSGGLILCDEEGPSLEYTFFVDDPTRLPSDLVIAFAYFLGSQIAVTITAGDTAGMGAACLKRYAYEIQEAQSNDAGEKQRDATTDTGSILARG